MSPAATAAPPGHRRGLRAVVAAGAVSACGYQANTLALPWLIRELGPEVAAGTTMYTSCQPCPMCATAIERSGLGRLVFALSAEQFESVKPATPAPAPVRYDGPALFAEARRPIEEHY
ncbi:deaminase [Verrucosispora sp. WMMD1129]|uniref:deaminase n=1 Tax=Verrucosispora sp. WMMD1129 TaxID=3016093 RepID=UPI00249CED36|nr:deaminase [Verrucosispora sp. WMMD1129]WFE47838.1 deaminase [Verrucosispora sp. WMMD1129]